MRFWGAVLSVYSAFAFAAMGQDCPTLVWSDEFEQESLNMDDWSFQTGAGGFGNNELQHYTDREENLRLEDGKLIITARAEEYGDEDYTSAKIWTNGKLSFRYGRMEARIKLPKTQGLWPAFWMMPQNSVYGGWPRSGEIDIMEMKGSDVYTTYGTVHYGTAPGAGHIYKGGTYSGPDDLSEDFHVYAVEWKEDTINWYFDDINFFTITKTDLGTSQWPFDQDFYLILNVAVGGFFGGNPNSSTVFPQSMEVDYVRVYSNPNTLNITGASKVIEGQTYTYRLTNGTADSYAWTVPEGATIVSGQGTSIIEVQWGSNGGDVAVDVERGACGSSHFRKAVTVIPNGCNVYFEDFESSRLLKYSLSSTGINYDEAIPNPASDETNGSSLVALYQRNPGEQYDVLKYDVNFLPTSADYENGTNVLYMDLYTSAPVGTQINWQFENKALTSQAYPVGRRAVFQGVTTKQNQWERIKFTLLSRPHLATPPTSIDQFSILFQPNVYAGTTFYIDNLMRRDVSGCGPITSVQNAYEQNFLVYPNPAQDELTLDMQSFPMGNTEVSIMDAVGMEKWSMTYEVSTASQQQVIDVSRLMPGLYVLFARQNGAVVASRKFVVQ